MTAEEIHEELKKMQSAYNDVIPHLEGAEWSDVMLMRIESMLPVENKNEARKAKILSLKAELANLQQVKD